MNLISNNENEMSGVVISSTPYRESDLILEILFEGVGKRSVIARGARKSKRRFFGGIEIFESGKFLLSPSKNKGILQIDGISDRTYLEGLRKNLFAFQGASLLIEVAAKLIPEEDHEAATLLPLILKLLRYLSSNTDKLQCMALLSYGILEICKYAGIDPVSEEKFFREDDRKWFYLLLYKQEIRTYEPLEASVRASECLVQFIQKNMQLKIKSEVPGRRRLK